MVWCPAGESRMGSPPAETDCGGDEKLHSVVLTKGFWLAMTECTQGQWRTVMGTSVRAQRDPDGPPDGADRVVRGGS